MKKVEKLSYFDDYSFVVSFCVNNFKGIGQLILKSSSLPILKIESSESCFEYYESLDINGDILCEEIAGSSSFRLHNCYFLHGVIYPKFITAGRVFYESNKVQIYLTGISQWFEGMRINDYKGDELIRDISIRKVKGSFCFNNDSYQIENERDVNVVSDSSTDYKVNIDYSLVITKEKGCILFEDVEGLTREIKNLFSILLGVPVSVRYLYLISEESNAKYNSVYFLHHSYDENPLKHYHQAFCSFNYICERNLFPVIVENFFLKKSFNTIWSRLIQIFRGNNAWDLDILSSVVVLEMYCSLVSAGKHHKLNKQLFKELRDKLESVIEGIINRPELDAQDIELISGIKTGIRGLKNTSFPTLKEKYNYLLESVSDSIKEAIALSESDFNLIKKIRNCVAHGLNYETLNSGDITQELRVKERLVLFLMYLAYKDLGFDDEQFAFCISYSGSSLSHSSNYNERAIDKLAKTSTFITLSEVYVNNYKIHKPIVIYHDLLSDSYKLDEKLSYETQHNWPNEKYHDVRDFVRSLITRVVKIEYLNKVYLKNGDDEKVYYGVLLIEDEN
ncbi:TPA: hypothetical protein R8G83_001926 [Citrobacter youngae]|nr:hypothetical protein [Citrobacter youngae]HEF0090323.1 hypothetical protein [Citrobacter youngae]